MRFISSFVPAVFCILLAAGPSAVRARGLLDIFPSYPIINVGDPIPDDTIKKWINVSTFCRSMQSAFNDFPAKADFKPKAVADADGPADDPVEKIQDARYYCDDGDQTTYNGMLCAAGVEIGCRAVAEAREASGRWFRSPHRRWMWSARCAGIKERQSPDYNNRCANGFSPDMNLGVLLYTLHTKNIDFYEKWLTWLDDNASKTVLCKVDGDEKTGLKVSDCGRQEWPRVCTDDIGFTKGTFPIFGKFGGNCSLRPWDALDFAAVNQALGVAPPSRMSNWEATSRVMIRTAKEIAGSVVPVTRLLDGPPLVLMAAFDTEKKYPLHLDAVRVLIRMIILNPSLKTDNLPPLPTLESLPGPLGVMASDATDPISVNIAARIIERRNPSNPFFVLLAEGPTAKVRDQILEKCPGVADPKEGDGISRSHWLWEKGPTEAIYNRNYSMGWDCVFVGSLYNKMRVRKDLAKELLDKLLALSDPVSTGLKHASEALQLLEADQALKQKGLDQAERDFANATDFRDKNYASLKVVAQNAIKEATNNVADLLKQQQNLQIVIPSLISKAASISIPNPPGCPPIDPGGACNKARNAVIDAAKALKSSAETQVSTAQAQLSAIQSSSLAAARAAIDAKTNEAAELEEKIQTIRKKLEKGAFSAAVAAARQHLTMSQQALDKGRNTVAEWKRADTRLQGTLAVWRNDDKNESQVSEPGQVAVLPPTKPTSVRK